MRLVFVGRDCEADRLSGRPVFPVLRGYGVQYAGGGAGREYLLLRGGSGLS